MSTLTQVNSPNFTDDGLGGTAVESKGDSSHVTGASLIGSTANTQFTTACIFSSPGGDGGARFISAADITPGNYQFKYDAGGNMGFIWRTGAGIEGVFSASNYQNSVISLGIITLDFNTFGSQTDHSYKMYVGPLSGTLEDLTGTQAANMSQWPSLSIAQYNGGTGSSFLVAGAFTGQVRAWRNKFCSSADALAIQSDYQDFIVATPSNLSRQLITQLSTSY